MFSENILLRQTATLLQAHLPPGWSADVVPTNLPESAGILRVSAPDGRTATLVVEVKRSLDPRHALELVHAKGDPAPSGSRLVVAPWMSAETLARLTAARINALDLSGNMRIALSDPGLFIEAHGAEHDPSPKARRATLNGTKAARLVRALCVATPPIGVRALAAAATASPGYVSKLLTLLDGQAALRRDEDGKVVGVDLMRLLEREAEDAPLTSRATITRWMDPRGLTAFLQKLPQVSERYAVTGSLAAVRKAPIAGTRLASIYAEDAETLARALGLRPAEAGANVLILVPNDELPFEGGWEDGGIRYAALPQVAVDLLSGPGRGPAEAEALVAWMKKHKEVWRG